MSTLSSDDATNVFLDWAMSSGFAKHVEAWTDEETERCRLVAFDLAQAAMYRGRFRSHDERWLRSYDFEGRGWAFSSGLVFCTERFFWVFDEVDRSLNVLITPALLATLKKGLTPEPLVMRVLMEQTAHWRAPRPPPTKPPSSGEEYTR